MPGHEGLPAQLRLLDYYERNYIDRQRDLTRFRHDRSKLEARFLPESGKLVDLRGYWINESDVESFSTPSLSGDLRRSFFRTHRGRRQVLLLVHPAARQHYRAFLNRAVETGGRAGERFLGSPTSSSRTLTVWRPGAEEQAWIVKLSLPLKITGLSRTIGPCTLARCIGATAVFDCAGASLPPTFAYMRESLGFMPSGMSDGGMLVRELPHLRDASCQYIPLFALYATPADGLPLLARLTGARGDDLLEWLQEKLIAPYARLWVDLAVEHGIVTEGHAQNLLLEFSADQHGQLRIVHRDFEDVYIDFAFRAAADLPLPAILPVARRFRHDYQLDSHRVWLRKSLYYYFQGGFLFMLNRRWNEWHQRGLVSGRRLAPNELERLFIATLEQVIEQKTGRRLRLDRGYRALIDLIYDERRRRYRYPCALDSPACTKLAYLRGAFRRPPKQRAVAGPGRGGRTTSAHR
jgi:hypothetical protein